ncbi:MAG: Lipid export ATP-binding/permease protein MsbA [Pseudomonadota bacterium]|jgi:subfamily B ATP-binding cassette protein MsbA
MLARFLSDWVFPRWPALLWALLLTALLSAATASYPKIIQVSFDTLLGGNSAVLHWVLAAIVGVTALRSILLYVQTVTTNRIVTRLTTDMQIAAFRHLISADYHRLSREAPGQFVSRLINDITFIQQAAQAALNSAIRDTLMIVALVAMMVYLDWFMSLIVLCVYPIAALPIAIISERLRRVAKQTQLGLGDMTSQLTEKLSSARLIKTYRLESYVAEKIDHSFEEVFRLRMRAVRNRARIDPLLEALGGLAVAGVVGLAYWRISNGVSTVGDFMGFVTALLMAAQPIRGLGNLSGKVKEGLAAVERIYEILDEKPRIEDRPGARPLALKDGTIAFQDVAFSYPDSGEAHAIENFTLTVAGGTTVALVGRSGAGKSTVINLVLRLFDVDGGAIRIDGQDIRDVELASLRDAISIVSQDVTLFDDTIAANIALGCLGASQEKIEAAARAAAAHEFIAAQPDGYRTMIGDRGMRLSGGQRQRLALARAILRDAPILLLDEATSALDTQSEQLVQAALARFTKNRTTIVIAHRLSTVQSADLICVMEAGRIVETGQHGELLAMNGAYRQLSEAQLLGAPE